MRFPLVSRLAFDVMQSRAMAAEERYDDLLAMYHGLKAQGQAVQNPRPLPPSRLPEPSPEERALLAHEQAFMANAEQAFLSQGKSPAEAKEMAALLRDGVRDSDTGIPHNMSFDG